jgi:hypothetical protein
MPRGAAVAYAELNVTVAMVTAVFATNADGAVPLVNVTVPAASLPVVTTAAGVVPSCAAAPTAIVGDEPAPWKCLE